MNHCDIQDFSCEIEMPRVFLDFIHDSLRKKQSTSEDGSVVLNKTTTDAFCWMLSTSGNVVSAIDRALYNQGEEGGNNGK